jgi:hypothetical protein
MLDFDTEGDTEIRDADLAYIEKHGLTSLLRDTMEAVLMSRPSAPIPFMLDCFQLGADKAIQDETLGISVWRKEELEKLYTGIVKVIPVMIQK